MLKITMPCLIWRTVDDIRQPSWPLMPSKRIVIKLVLTVEMIFVKYIPFGQCLSVRSSKSALLSTVHLQEGRACSSSEWPS